MTSAPQGQRIDQMRAPREMHDFSSEEGLTFLEHLAHELTVAVRVAMDDCEPEGSLSEEQCRRAMFWVNEATHQVVQFTRDLRLGRKTWDAGEIAEWLEHWMGYAHGAVYIQNGVDRALRETLYPYRPT